MDRFSFLNAVHSQFIEDMYQQYLKYPDSLEPSWKAFFRGLISLWKTTVMKKQYKKLNLLHHRQRTAMSIFQKFQKTFAENSK